MEMLSKGIEGITVVYLGGRLDIFEAESAEMNLFEIAEKNSGNSMIIVLEGLDYLSSSGLRIFISLKRQLDAQGRRLALCNFRNNAVHNFFRIINIKQMFDIFRTEDEAVRYIVSKKMDKSDLVA
jgi:anti-sigma B factor antagonist